jgi:hypothetical protein
MDQLIVPLVSLLGLFIWAAIAYVVIKAAVKAGINESNLCKGPPRVNGQPQGQPSASVPGRATEQKKHGFLDNPFSPPTRPVVPPEMAKIHAQVKKLN